MRRMFKRVLPVFFVIAITFVAVAPTFVLGAGLMVDGSLVPVCDKAAQVQFQGACQLCDLLTLANNLIQFGVGFSVFAATLTFAYAGVLYFTSAAQDNIKKAHSIFVKVFAGLVIILIAWLLVDLFMKTFTGQGISSPRYKITCSAWPVGGSLKGHGTQGATFEANVPVSNALSSCSVSVGGPCDPKQLSKSFSVDAAAAASTICMQESSGQPTKESIDKLADGVNDFSFGLFQINSTAHDLNVDGCPKLQCTQAYQVCKNDGGQQVPCNSKGLIQTGKVDLYNQCKEALVNPDCNIAMAREIYKSAGNSFSRDWVNSANSCGIR